VLVGGFAVTVTVGVPLIIVSVRFAEAPLLVLSPPYVATIASAPSGNVEIVSVATPFAIVPLPIGEPLLVNATDPVTVVGRRVAVKVTGWFAWAGFNDEISVIDEATFETVSVVVAVAVSYVLSPLYVAVIVSVPTGSTVVVIDVAPLLNVPVPSVTPPLVNVTVPVAPDVTVELIVTV